MRSRRYACLPHDPLADGRFFVTAVQDDHIEPIRAWRNAQLDVLRQSSPLSEADQRIYYETNIWSTLDHPRPQQVLLSFFEDDRLLGYGGLVHISWPDRRAEVSFLLDPHGPMTVPEYARLFSGFLSLVKQLAFTELGMHRLWTETYATRKNHIAVLEANGFCPEGRLRQHVQIGGAGIDSLIHGCLAHER